MAVPLKLYISDPMLVKLSSCELAIRIRDVAGTPSLDTIQSLSKIGGQVPEI